MKRHEIEFYFKMALRQVFEAQKALLGHKHKDKCLHIFAELNSLGADLSDWLNGKYETTNPVEHFFKRSRAIEKKASDLSEILWCPVLVNIERIFGYIRTTENKLKNEVNFKRSLETHLDIIRLGLLEQVKGARLLENNSDLGEEIEKIFAEFLQDNLGNNVKVLRGGHIYDHENNRSNQMDIIVTIPEAIAFCPSETRQGKNNALVDQVIAAFSIKSTLTKKEFHKAWKDIQSIPVFKDKEKEYTGLKNHAWPLCFIFATSTTSLKEIEKEWEKLALATPTHFAQIVYVLDSGYGYPGNTTWPLRGYPHRRPDDIRFYRDLDAGLGLGWIIACIIGRAQHVASPMRPLKTINRIAEMLEYQELREAVSPTDNYDPIEWRCQREIAGIINWGRYGKRINNKVYLTSIDIDNKTVVDASTPKKKNYIIETNEPRWFNARCWQHKGTYCVLHEWLNPDDKKNHEVRKAVFNTETGEEYVGEEKDRIIRELEAHAEYIHEIEKAPGNRASS